MTGERPKSTCDECSCELVFDETEGYYFCPMGCSDADDDASDSFDEDGWPLETEEEAE